MHAGRILQLDHNRCVLDAPGLLSTANAHGARAKLSICALPRRPRAEVRGRDQGHTALKKQHRYSSVFAPAKTHHRQLGRIRLTADTNQGPVRIRRGITIGYRERIDSGRKQSPSAPRARVRVLCEDGRGPVQIRRSIEAIGPSVDCCLGKQPRLSESLGQTHGFLSLLDYLRCCALTNASAQGTGDRAGRLDCNLAQLFGERCPIVRRCPALPRFGVH